MNRSIRFTRFGPQAARTALSVFMMVCLLLAAMPQALATEPAPQAAPLTVDGVSALLIDADRGQQLYAKQENEAVRVGIASRLMTVYLALTNAKPNALVTASSEAAGVEDAQLSLRVGEKYGVEALCYAVLLTGASDAAVALAEFTGGSVHEFVAMMNASAEKLGMHGTHFMNPSGMNDDHQVTTAADLALFMKTALKDATFARLFAAQAKPWYDDRKTTLLTNRNTMFWSYDGTDGGISGSTDPLIESMITTATRNGLRLICILLDEPAASKTADCTNLLNHGFTNYRYGKLVSAGQTLKTVTVENQSLNLLARTDEYYVYPIGEIFVQDMTTAVDESKMVPPILADVTVGKAIFTLADKTVIEVDLVPETSILPQKSHWQVLWERMLDNREILLLVAILSVVEVVWFLIWVVTAARRRLRRHRHPAGMH